MLVSGSSEKRAAPGNQSRDNPLVVTVFILLVTVLIFETIGTVQWINFGGFILNAPDLGFFLASAAAILCLRRKKNFSLAMLVLGILCLLVIMNFVRGLDGDVSKSFVWLRNNGAIVPLAILAATAQANQRTADAIYGILFYSALGLTILMILRVIFNLDLFSALPQGELKYINEGRPLSMRGGMILAMAVVTLLSKGMQARWSEDRWRYIFVGIFLAVLIGTGQGTATIAGVAGVAILMLLEKGPTLTRRVIVISFCLMTASAAMLLPFDQLLPKEVQDNLSGRTRNREFRQYIWQGFVNHYGELSDTDKIIGPPAHEPPQFIVFTPNGPYDWKLSLHSMYYGELANFGIVGLAMYLIFVLCLAVQLFIQRLAGTNVAFFSPSLGLALIAQGVLLGYSYELRNELLLFLILPLIMFAGQRLPSDKGSGFWLNRRRPEDVSGISRGRPASSWRA